MAINSVILANTFNEFRTTVNEVITTVNAVSGGSGVINANSLIGGTVTANNLTSGRVTLSGTAGQLVDDSALTYNTSTDILTLAGTTDASSTTTGTLIIAGGVGVAKKLYVGTDLAVSGNATVTGDLTINGTTTTVNSTTLTVDDKNIELGSVTTPTNITANGGGITLKGATDKTIIYDNTNDNWTSSENWNIDTGKSFKINNVSVLNATTLGSSVVTSSLTSTGTITSGTWSGSFGAVSGANLTTLNASNLSTGTVAVARLATSGTPSSSTFLRGDSVWASAAVSIIDDTATNSTFFPVFTSVTTGSIVGANTSSTKLTFNPSSGLLTSTDYNSSSDITLKENFTQIVNPLDIISQLEGFGFSWKDTKEKSYGLSAQQVETVLPEIVRVRPDGTKGINYLNLIAFLVEGIKDLKEEVRQLKSYK